MGNNYRFYDLMNKCIMFDVEKTESVKKTTGMNSCKQGVKPKDGFVSKQSVTSRTINGSAIELNIITHSHKQCQEFVIKSPEFSFRRWLLWTFIIYVFGCYMQLHVQDISLMAYVGLVLLLVLFFKLQFKVKKESLLVMTSIGVQLTTTFASGRKISMFYDMANIRDIVINEAVTVHRVIYYLAILLHQCSSPNPTITSLVPLYTHSWPALRCLLLIRTEISKLLNSDGIKNDMNRFSEAPCSADKIS